MATRSLKILSLDGGGMKGYTSLIILKRLFRTIQDEDSLAEEPKPCDMFDLIIGTSTGGLIAVMLGRLGMTIDECLQEFENTGRTVFDRTLSSTKLGKFLKGTTREPFYDIGDLQKRVKDLLRNKNLDIESPFLENDPKCKVVVAVTRSSNRRPELLRNWRSVHSTQENYKCKIWEAASATAAAPLFFKSVTLENTKIEFVDGGMRRNNPVNEAINETNRLKATEKTWAERSIGCIVSIGTGAVQELNMSSSISDLVKSAVAMMTDSEQTAEDFLRTELGQQLHGSKRYFRFNVDQGIQLLQMDEWRKIEQMSAATTEYLTKYHNGSAIRTCALTLLNPDRNIQQWLTPTPVLLPTTLLLPNSPCVNFVNREDYIQKIQDFFRLADQGDIIYVLSGMPGVGKTQLALKFAELSKDAFSIIWVRADNWTNFAKDFANVILEIFPEHKSEEDATPILQKTKQLLEKSTEKWLLLLDNADNIEDFTESIVRYLPKRVRILITTRDCRFQGTIAGSQNGCYVEVMQSTTVENLVRKSVPRHLLPEESLPDVLRYVWELLGNLPLAIAQAVAYIVETDITFSKFFEIFRSRPSLEVCFNYPFRDKMTSDERNSLQSVSTTWNMSFVLLKEVSPLAVVLLGYLACYQNGPIRYLLLQQLPEFKDMNDTDFFALIGKLHQLCLAERVFKDNIRHVQMHPIAQEVTFQCICEEQKMRWIAPIVDLLASLITPTEDTLDDGWQLNQYLALHALKIINLALGCRKVSDSLKELCLLLSHFNNIYGEFDLACELANTALDIAIMIHGLESYGTFEARQIKIECLWNASKFDLALPEARIAWSYSETDACMTDLSRTGTLLLQLKLCFQITNIFEFLEEYEDKDRNWFYWKTMEILAAIEANVTDFDQMIPQSWFQPMPGTSFSRLSFLRLQLKHLISDFLLNAREPTLTDIEQSFKMNDEVLAEIEDKSDPTEHNPDVTVLKDDVLRTKKTRHRHLHGGSDQFSSEEFAMFLSLYYEYLSRYGITHRMPWSAANVIFNFLITSETKKEQAKVWDSLLDAAMEPGVELPISNSVGPFLQTLKETFDLAPHWMEKMSSKELDAFRQKLYSVKRDFSRGLLSQDSDRSDAFREGRDLNAQGVQFSALGQLDKAEECYRKAATLMESSHDYQDKIDKGIPIYNVMTSISQQGRVEEAFAYREQHQGLMWKGEWSREDLGKIFYNTAGYHIDQDPSRTDLWWQKHNEAVRRVEAEYGNLVPAKNSESRPKTSRLKDLSKQLTQFVLGRPLRRKS